MQHSIWLLFQNLTAGNWLNLALAGVLAFHLFYVARKMILGTTCVQIGADFCDYWSAGRVATIPGAWHSHICVAIVPVPTMILLLGHGVLPMEALFSCAFLASSLYLLRVLSPPVLLRLQLISNPGAPFVHLPIATAQLISTPHLLWRAPGLPPRPA